MAKNRRGICTYCGELRHITSDHIPPKCVFPSTARLNLNLVTVPACSECNNGAKIDDEEFKLFVSMSAGISTDAQQVLLESVRRTLAKNRRLSQKIAQRTTPLISLGGFSFPELYQVSWETEPVRRVISRIVRGLHWHHYKVRLPTDTKVSVVFPDEIPSEKTAAFSAFIDKFIQACAKSRIGNHKEFLYFHGKARDNDSCSFWIFLFYERMLVLGSSGFELAH